MMGRVVTSVAIAMAAERSLAMPGWALSNTQELSGSTYRVVCSGQGPSIDLARREAEQSCKASAAGKLSTTGTVSVVTIETEKDIGLHQEVSERISYRNLLCEPENEAVDEGEGHITVWLKCRFNLLAASTAADDSPEPGGATAVTEEAKVTLTPIASGPVSQVSSSTSLSVSVVPACDDILVSGGRPRVVRCDGNPVSVVVTDADSVATVRAKGYQPKKIKLKGSGRSFDSIQVIMERN
jgi:hypothetical protein